MYHEWDMQQQKLGDNVIQTSKLIALKKRENGEKPIRSYQKKSEIGIEKTILNLFVKKTVKHTSDGGETTQRHSAFAWLDLERKEKLNCQKLLDDLGQVFVTYVINHQQSLKALFSIIVMPKVIFADGSATDATRY